jgi:hypothetical protein
MADVIDAPAPVQATPAASPAPPPAATDGGPGTDIHVTPATVDRGPSQAPPKKGSTMERVLEDLRKRAKPQFYEESPPESPPAAPKPPTPPEGSPPQEGEGKPTPPPPAPEKEKSKNPWKLVDEYKARAAKAETETLELRKSGFDATAKKSYEDQLSQLRKQNEELEKHLRYVDYQKSAEFKNKYEAPYEKAWDRAAKEVAEIMINDPEAGGMRHATVKDLYAVVVAPLNEARDIADNVFGKFADDVMAYRKEIRGLNDAQQMALKEARDNSITRDKEVTAQREAYLTKTAGEIKQLWDTANHEFGERSDLAFIFKPGDTDDDHKSRLEKGYALVDKAFAVNSADPRLTAEQRAEAVKMHAAVRMRAAGFGPLRAKYDAAIAKISALEKELAGFKNTVPPVSGTNGEPSAPASSGKAWDQIRAGLQKIAKPIG